MIVAPGIGVITLDTELCIRSWNDWVARATGMSELEAQGRLLISVVPAARAALIGEELAGVLRTGVTRVLAPAFHRFLLQCPAPERNAHFDDMQQRVTLAPLRDDAAIVGIIITVEDVTARIIAEREHAAHLAETRTGGSSLIAAAGADDWRVRAAATGVLKQGATEEEIAQLLLALERDHHNFSVLSGALQVLASAHHEVTSSLVSLLKSPDANVRMHAAQALGALGDAAGGIGLLHALADEDSNVRFHAIEALGRLQAPDAVAGLQHVAEEGDFFLAFPAIDALARIDDAAVVPALIALAERDDLRPAVVDALAALGDEDCVRLLTTLINDGRGDVAQVSSALVRIARRYEETFGASAFVVDATRETLSFEGVGRLASAMSEAPSSAVVLVLGWVGGPGLEAVVSAVGHRELRAEVTEAILGIGAPAVPLLISHVRHGSRDASVAAASLLGAIGDARGSEVLENALTSHDNELVTTAARALAALGARSAMQPLLALFAHEDMTVRQTAVAAVNSLGAEEAESRLSERLDATDARVRECAVRAAGYFAFDSCADGIARAASDENEDVRRAALEQLPLLERRGNLEVLLAALRGETPRNRAAAAHALRLVEGEAVDAALIAALDDDTAWVRYFAAGSLAQRGTVDAVNVLQAMAQADAAPYVRIAAIRALAMLDARALRGVAFTAVEDADEEVAAAALRGVAGHDEPAVEQLLDDAVRSAGPALRLAAVEALGASRSAAAVQTLAWAARLADPPSLSAAATESLRRIAATMADSGSIAVTALIQLGAEAERRESVIRSLSSLPPHRIGDIAATMSSPRADVRVLAVEALARMCHPAATEVVAGSLSDVDSRVRAAAVDAFGRLGSLGVESAVALMSVEDPAAAVRRRAAAVCRRYGWTRSTGARIS